MMSKCAVQETKVAGPRIQLLNIDLGLMDSHVCPENTAYGAIEEDSILDYKNAVRHMEMGNRAWKVLQLHVKPIQTRQNQNSVGLNTVSEKDGCYALYPRTTM